MIRKYICLYNLKVYTYVHWLYPQRLHQSKKITGASGVQNTAPQHHTDERENRAHVHTQSS